MKKQLIRLTESELEKIIQESVKSILSENMEDEGLWDTVKSFAGQYGKRGKEQAQNLGRAAGQQMKQGYNAMKQGINNGYNAMKQGYNNVKQDINNTMQNARQDGAMKDMQKAFNNFKTAVANYKSAGGKVNGQLGSSIAGIDKMMNGYQSHY